MENVAVTSEILHWEQKVGYLWTTDKIGDMENNHKLGSTYSKRHIIMAEGTFCDNFLWENVSL